LNPRMLSPRHGAFDSSHSRTSRSRLNRTQILTYLCPASNRAYFKKTGHREVRAEASAVVNAGWVRTMMPSFRGRNRQTDPRKRKKQISRNRRHAYLASYHHCVGIGQRSVDGERSVEESVGDVRMQRELLRFNTKASSTFNRPHLQGGEVQRAEARREASLGKPQMELELRGGSSPSIIVLSVR
jgi:hypothetical protein